MDNCSREIKNCYECTIVGGLKYLVGFCRFFVSSVYLLAHPPTFGRLSLGCLHPLVYLGVFDVIELHFGLKGRTSNGDLVACLLIASGM